MSIESEDIYAYEIRPPVQIKDSLPKVEINKAIKNDSEYFKAQQDEENGFKKFLKWLIKKSTIVGVVCAGFCQFLSKAWLGIKMITEASKLATFLSEICKNGEVIQSIGKL
jgi:hypothetical protein